MQSRFKYFPVSSTQKTWGLFVTCAGHGRSDPGAAYPPRTHPDEYFFTWERGRALKEWQIVLVAAGRGDVEFRSRRLQLAEGSLLVLPPECWHRYRPDPANGWTTHWIGFGGDQAGRLMGCAGFGTGGDVRDLSGSPVLGRRFAALVDAAVRLGQGRPYETAASLGVYVAALVEEAGEGRSGPGRHEDLVRRAQAHIAEHCAEVVDFEALAVSLGLPYRTFRHVFAKECGMPPHRYQLHVRLARAKHLLASSDLPVAEIASALGFRSTWYFAHFFQRGTGRSATQFRRALRRGTPPHG